MTRQSTAYSRRHALAAMLGTLGWLPKALAAAETEGTIRLAISESLVVDANLNDARAAMRLWLKRIMTDTGVALELSPKVFDPTELIIQRARSGELDAVALNVVEYRQIAAFLDPSELIVGTGGTGPDQYLLLAKRNRSLSGISGLRGGRLCLLKTPPMCVAPAWLSTLLDAAHLGPAEEFFGPIGVETKASRVVLPVFFGQGDACIVSKRGFETMCELNPQVAGDLFPIATSPLIVHSFYAFRKNYRGAGRTQFLKVHSTLLSNAAGRQMATLFQFDGLTVRDAGCLTGALRVLDQAERIRGRKGKVPDAAR